MAMRRQAWLYRHIGDRADTGYVITHPDAKRIWRKRIGAVGTGVLAGIAIWPVGEYLGALCCVSALVLAAGYGRSTMRDVAQHRRVLSALAKMPRGNVVFNWVKVPTPDGTAEHEIQYLVVTQKGFLVVEVVAEEGVIQGDAEGAMWTVSTGAGAQHRRIANPCTMVKEKVYALSRLTNDAGLKGRIAGMVVVAGERFDVRGESTVFVTAIGSMGTALPKADPTGARRRAQLVQDLVDGVWARNSSSAGSRGAGN